MGLRRKWIISGFAIGMSIFQLYTTIFGLLPPMFQRGIHYGFALILVYLVHPSKQPRERLGWGFLDFTLLGGSVLFCFYIPLDYDRLLLSGRDDHGPGLCVKGAS
jgi:TRAP-type uncharacterized transport system fused permease subunit